MRRARSLSWTIAAALGALAALPPLAGAVLSGTNGRIIFVSGRDQASDARRASPSAPRSTSTRTMAANGDCNCRWSPDGTQVAYVRAPSA